MKHMKHMKPTDPILQKLNAREVVFENPTASAFGLTVITDIEMNTERHDIVQGLIPKNAVALVWGPPKCAKSFWVLDVAMHIATGRKYRDRDITKGTVVYCAFEGGGAFPKRIEAWKKAHNVTREQLLEDDVKFAMMPRRLDLVEDNKALIADIKNFMGTMDVIVLDTLNQSMRGSESSDADMAAYLKAATAIRDEFSCTVIIVHHCGHQGDRPRGHSSLTGAVDAQIKISRKKKENSVTAELEFSKDGEGEGDKMSNALRVLNVGEDVAGNQISSCYIEPRGNVIGEPTNAPGGQAGIALKALQEVCIESTTKVPFNFARGAYGVKEDVWRKRFYEMIPGLPPDSKRKAFQRTSVKLVGDGFAACRDRWVFVPLKQADVPPLNEDIWTRETAEALSDTGAILLETNNNTAKRLN